MKKLFSVLLAASFSLSSAAVAFADEDETLMDFDTEIAEEQGAKDKDKTDSGEGKVFSDITAPQYSWAYPFIVNMVDAGYINGYEDNTFRPDNSVTRLEVLALFSRALGFSDDMNEPIAEMAIEKYKPIINKYGLEWGIDEIAFLMYRDVLTESDLVTYLKDELKNEPMPRYEAAIIITKAMGGESEATADSGVSLTYTDKKSIPANALQYVAYVSNKEIMNGMEDGSFSPSTSVSRAQMAVMLSRTCGITKYTYLKGKLLGVDTSGRLITYRNEDGINEELGYSKNVIMNVLGEAVTPKQMTVGVDAIITKSGNNVVFIDTLVDVPDAEISGKFLSRSTSGNVTSVTVLNSKTEKRETYECSPDLTVVYDNSPGTLTNFLSNDAITLKLVAGKIVSVIGETKSTTILNAVIEDITLEPEFTIKISHAKEEYNDKVLPVDTTATVRKNGVTADFSQIYPGDTVALTLDYGVVVAVTANSSTSNAEGVIQEIRISTRPAIDVKLSNGNIETYYVTNDVQITVNGADKTLYDFRVGDTVKITLEGMSVIKITATSSSSSSGKLEGTVVSVNSSYGFIKIAYQTASGYTAEETVYCKDSTTTVMTDMGANKKVADIKDGQTVIATGTTTNGAFAAKVIVISSLN